MMYSKEKWMEMWETDRDRERERCNTWHQTWEQRGLWPLHRHPVFYRCPVLLAACCPRLPPLGCLRAQSACHGCRAPIPHTASPAENRSGSDSPSLAFKSTKHVLGYFEILACADLSKTWLKRSTALNKIHTHTQACTHPHTCTPMHAPTHIHTHAPLHIHMHSYIHIHACIHLHAYTHPHACMHPHITHACTHTQTPTTKQD